jgi:uncharacterized DUF497 family protein
MYYTVGVRYEWDEKKRRRNLRKHGLDFFFAPRVFDGPTFTIEDDRYEYDEPRFGTFGLLDGVVVVVIHTERPGVIRIISMRKASRHEEKNYFDEVANGLEAASRDD